MPFRLANVAGRAALVDDHDRWYDLEARGGPSDPMAALEQPELLAGLSAALDGAGAGGEMGDADLRAPVPRPRNVFGVGLNYRTHAEESNMEPPATPLVFTKFPSCIGGPNDDVILATETGDWEVELVVVIGKGGKDIARTEVWDRIAGLTVGQDISDRALQFAASPPHFDLGKSRDTYGPIGPIVASTDSFANPRDLAISCSINGERKQDDRTSSLIFDVEDLVCYLSAIMTLTCGDLIFTGTPAGVGAATRTYLRAGDVIESSVEGIGSMTNRCR